MDDIRYLSEKFRLNKLLNLDPSKLEVDIQLWYIPPKERMAPDIRWYIDIINAG